MKKLLNWILQHIILLIVLMLLGIGAFFRHEIFGLPSSHVDTVQQSVDNSEIKENLKYQGVHNLNEPALEPNPDDQPATSELIETDKLAVVQSTGEAGDDFEQTGAVAENNTQSSDTHSVVIKDGRKADHAQTQHDSLKEHDLIDSPGMIASKNNEDEGETAASLSAVKSGATFNEEPEKSVFSNSNNEQLSVSEELTPIEEQALSLKYRPNEKSIDSQSSPTITRDVYLNDAREAYWNGAEDKAVGIYQVLIDFSPNDPDIYGELGNIFLKQGNSQAAFDYYTKAVLLLKQLGKDHQAAEFIGAVKLFDSQLGDQLHAQINEKNQ